MNNSGTAECEQGHRVAGDNLYLDREGGRMVPRCRTCIGAAPNPVEKRERAAQLARERRARLRASDPAQHAAKLARENSVRKARERQMDPMALAEITRQKNARRYESSRAIRALNVTGEEYNSILEELTMTEVELARNQNRPSAAWNMLKVKGDALPAWDEFSKYLDETETPCQGSTAWTEYDDPRPGREDEATGVPMPTKSVAAKMCEQCPLIDLCQNFAKRDKPDFGVWGGERWLGGKRV